MTPLGRVPGARVTRYLGSVSLHFIKESWAASRGGEVASFFHEFVMEVSEREESLVVVNLLAPARAVAVFGFRMYPAPVHLALSCHPLPLVRILPPHKLLWFCYRVKGCLLLRMYRDRDLIPALKSW